VDEGAKGAKFGTLLTLLLAPSAPGMLIDRSPNALV
jgi:hypothetical protein